MSITNASRTFDVSRISIYLWRQRLQEKVRLSLQRRDTIIPTIGKFKT